MYSWQCLFRTKDIDGWCNLAAFDLPEDSPSPERHQFRLEGSALQELSKGCKGGLIPISPGGITPPSILNHRSRRRITLSPDGNNSMTPKSTPVKILPFSPSQVRPHSLYWGTDSEASSGVKLRYADKIYVVTVPQYVDHAGLPWPREPIPHIYASVQSKSYCYNATSARQDPPHSEGKLSVSHLYIVTDFESRFHHRAGFWVAVHSYSLSCIAVKSHVCLLT